MMIIRVITALILISTILGPTAHLMQYPIYWNNPETNENKYLLDTNFDTDEVSIPMDELNEEFEKLTINSSEESSYVDLSLTVIFPLVIKSLISSYNNLFDKIIELIRIKSLSRDHYENTDLQDFLTEDNMALYNLLLNGFNNHFDLSETEQMNDLHQALLEITSALLTPKELGHIFDRDENDIRYELSQIFKHSINLHVIELIPLLIKSGVTATISYEVLSELLSATQQSEQINHLTWRQKNEIIDTLIDLYTQNPFNQLHQSIKIKHPKFYKRILITGILLIILFIFFCVTHFFIEIIQCHNYQYAKLHYPRCFPDDYTKELEKYCGSTPFEWSHGKREYNCANSNYPPYLNINPNLLLNCEKKIEVARKFSECASQYLVDFAPKPPKNLWFITCDE